MNYAHLHLILNHIPVVALPLATLFLAFAVYKKNIQMKIFSLMILICVGLVTVPTYFTGEPAEHMIEDFPGVRENVISPHEEGAEKVLIVVLVMSATAIAALALQKNQKRHEQLVIAVLCLAAFGSAGLMYTGYTGGQIRHTEARLPVFLPAEK